MSRLEELSTGTARQLVDRNEVKEGMTVVAGVSGGADSVFLLHVLREVTKQQRLSVICACLDHGLRDDSRNEYEFVSTLSRQMGFRFHGGTTKPGQLAGSAGESMEMAARRVRHRFLQSVAAAHNADWIALGHNGTDNLETICMNISRGTGLRGLGGMSDTGNGMIRPLLTLAGEEIRQALDAAGIGYMTDSSNADETIQRNRVRNILVPAWRDTFGNDAVKRWMDTAVRIRHTRSALDELLRRHLAGSVDHWNGAVRLEQRMVCNTNDALAIEILFHLLERCTGSTWFASATIIAELLRFCRKSGYGEVDPFRKGTLQVYRSGRWIYFMQNQLAVQNVSIRGPGSYPGWFGTLVVSEHVTENIGQKVVSHVEIPFPWTSAPIVPGDVVRIGRTETDAGRFLKENGFGKLEREWMPVLKQGRFVFWIPEKGPVGEPVAQDRDRPILVYMDTRAGLQSAQITGQECSDV